MTIGSLSEYSQEAIDFAEKNVKESQLQGTMQSDLELT